MEDCIFCKIVRGEIPSERVLEDDATIAIRDLDPKAPVHLLVIPRTHRAFARRHQPAQCPADP